MTRLGKSLAIAALIAAPLAVATIPTQPATAQVYVSPYYGAYPYACGYGYYYDPYSCGYGWYGYPYYGAGWGWGGWYGGGWGHGWGHGWGRGGGRGGWRGGHGGGGGHWHH